jgi:hypothetical protein
MLVESEAKYDTKTRVCTGRERKIQVAEIRTLRSLAGYTRLYKREI